ncbi:MAG: response regulator [Vicinamibacterales bacterium]
MQTSERRTIQRRDRRAAPRGGRRPYDLPGRAPKLLLADSYDGARVPCARYLDHFGFHVDQVSDGDDALLAMRANQVQLVLAELSLPKVSAKELADWLEREDATQRVPLIILLSDFDTDVSPLLTKSAAILVKPFPLATMLQEVRKALRTRTAEVSEPLASAGGSNRSSL